MAAISSPTNKQLLLWQHTIRVDLSAINCFGCRHVSGLTNHDFFPRMVPCISFSIFLLPARILPSFLGLTVRPSVVWSFRSVVVFCCFFCVRGFFTSEFCGCYGKITKFMRSQGQQMRYWLSAGAEFMPARRWFMVRRSSVPSKSFLFRRPR